MKLAFGILSVPQRAGMASALARSLQAGMAVPQPVTISVDPERMGSGRNTVQLLRSVNHTADVVVVLQDDVVVCRNFVRALYRSLPYLYAAKGLVAASYFANTKKVVSAQSDHRWLRYSIRAWQNWMWTYAYALPMQVAQQYVSWFQRHDDQDDWPDAAFESTSQPGRRRMVADDITLSAFLKESNVPVYLSTLTLAQHMGGVSSLLGHRFDPATGKNYSPYFIGEDADGLAFDWSKV